jgi:SAM-dependent methyltransferase
MSRTTRPDPSGSPDAASYDAVAHEYYDLQAHPTCHAFNRLSRLYLERRFPEPWGGEPIIEIGAGASSAASLLHARGYRLEGLRITDNAAAMLQHSERWRAFGAELTHSNADAISADDGSCALLVAGLGDPYNVPAFWAEAARVLRPGGRALFTTPSHEWSLRYRGDGDARFAEFLLTDGQRLSLPSIVVSLDAQVRMMQAAGFSVIDFESLGAEALHPAEPRSPKLDVFGAEPSSLVWGFELTRRDPLV